MEKPTIGILTTFYELNPAYSLSTVVESQLRSLVKAGYKTVFFVHDNFKSDDQVPEGVEVRKIVPRFLLVDYADHREPMSDLQQQADKAYEAIKENTKDVDVIIAHDLIFQGWFLPYCMAIHKLAEESDIKWLHWVHSVPHMQPSNLKHPHTLRYHLPRNSKLVYLNHHDVVRVAEAWNTFPKDVKVVHNPLDPRLFMNLHPLVTSLIDKYGLLEADIIQAYPVSTPRMVDGKKVKDVIKIFAQLKKLGKDVRLIVCNAHANDKREKDTIAGCLNYANQHGLSAGEVIFTSLEDAPTYEQGVPREVISQLFQLSNVFIFPTISENCSLILLEAMLSKNLCILNKSVESLYEFGKENALYFDFGSIHKDVNINDFDKYTHDIAQIIVSELGVNKSLCASANVRQHHNFEYILKQIEPLFYG